MSPTSLLDADQTNRQTPTNRSSPRVSTLDKKAVTTDAPPQAKSRHPLSPRRIFEGWQKSPSSSGTLRGRDSVEGSTMTPPPPPPPPTDSSTTTAASRPSQIPKEAKATTSPVRILPTDQAKRSKSCQIVAVPRPDPVGEFLQHRGASVQFSTSPTSLEASATRLSRYSSSPALDSVEVLSPSKHKIPIPGLVEVIPNRLFWVSIPSFPKPIPGVHFFSVDNEYVYEPFFLDFGPLNLGMVFRFCKLLEGKLTSVAMKDHAIVHFCSNEAHKRANAGFLMIAFRVIVLRQSSDDAWASFSNVSPAFLPFRDATYGLCSYGLTVRDCVKGLEFAIKLKWFNYESFDITSYERYERMENGDLNWIIPGKFVAFSAPSATSVDEEGYLALTPEDYVPIFKKLGVTMVIRLNKRQYERKRFTSQGINHVDLFFLDGSCPSREIIHKFLELTENEPGAIAVHCKAGLGRTGTLIGCYAIKNYGFPAAQWIGWNRIARPGSVLGPQQYFLNEIQKELLGLGAVKPRTDDLSAKLQNMSLSDRRTATLGDQGQGERLVGAKRNPLAKSGNQIADTPSSQEVVVVSSDMWKSR